MDDAAMTIHVQVFLWTYIFIYLRYKPRNGTAESHVNSTFNLEEMPGYFPKWLHHFTFPPIVHKYCNFTASPTLPVFWLSLLILFFIVTIQMSVNWYLIVVYICIAWWPIILRICHLVYWTFLYFLLWSVCLNLLHNIYDVFAL